MPTPPRRPSAGPSAFLNVALGGIAACAAASCAPGPATAQAQAAPASSIESAAKNFPPALLFANVRAVGAGQAVPRACPPAGSRVEQKGGPTFEFLGADPAQPELCRMKVGGEAVQAWYGIWLTDWPGADQARRGLAQVMQARTGDVVGFDTVAGTGAQWHDLIRQDGVEEITLLGRTFQAVKIAHYREGFGGNNYRSVSTLWKDLATGLPLYGTYQHISGQPVVDDPLIPTAIVP